MSLRPGDILAAILEYWYFVLPVLALVIGFIAFMILRRKRERKQRITQKVVDAIVFTQGRRQKRTVPQSEIENFAQIVTREYKKHPVILLEEISIPVVAEKPPGDGDHKGNGEHNEHAEEAATAGKRKTK